MDLDESERLYRMMMRRQTDLYEKRLWSQTEEDDLREAAITFEEHDALYPAMELYDRIDADADVIRIGNQAMMAERYMVALDAFGRVNEDTHLSSLAQQADEPDIVYEIVERHTDMIDSIEADYGRWVCAQDVDPDSTVIDKRRIPRAAAMAEKTAQSYDLGVAIATGGLFLAYFFDQFGLDTAFVEYHRDDDDNAHWYRRRPIVDDKRVLLIDEDVITGETVQTVGESIVEKAPESVGLALQRGEKGHYGSNLGNLPECINSVHTPRDEGVSGYFDSVEVLYENIQ